MSAVDVLYLGTAPEVPVAAVPGVGHGAGDGDGESTAVCLVRSARAARRRVEEAPFDRLVVDHPFPGTDLPEFLREVRERTSDVSIVVDRRHVRGDPTVDPGLYDAKEAIGIEGKAWEEGATLGEAKGEIEGAGHGGRTDADELPVRDEDGDPRYVCGIGRDVADRHRGESELRRERDLVGRILGTSPIGIMVLDPEGTVTRANARANEILGRPGEGLVGGSYGDLPLTAPDGDGRTDGVDPIEEVISTGEPVMDVHQRVGPSDAKRWVSTNVAPLSDDGGVERVIVTLEDVTARVEHRRRLEEKQAELDDTVEELRRSNAELEQFAYVASHDIKEPLRVVSNYLQLLERRHADELDDDALEFVDLAVEAADRLRNRVDDLLMYSRIDRSGGALEPVDTNGIVETTLSSLAISIREADAEVTVGDLPTVMGDEDQLGQLFQNLLANAIEHAGADPPRIHVSGEREGDEAVLAVADEGVGIPPARQDRIFDLFFSGDDSDSTGIGLAICRKIVERHGGRIRVTSEPGEGSTVHVALPVPDG